MFTSLLRTVVLLFVVMVSLRMMGKRQIGELQPGELVVTILLSQIAATPMQDIEIPLLHTLVSIFTLVGIEILLSGISMKSVKMRDLIDGKSVTVIRNGVIDQKKLKSLRFTIDDLLEGLRAKDVFDVSQVESAVVETNGSLSVLLKVGEMPVNNTSANVSLPETGIAQVLVADGEINYESLTNLGMTEKQLFKIIKKENAELNDVFLLTSDKTGKTFFVKKEKEND
ncbi:MAG: DUF421 domain-containing protein [Oscillospiraceae bacterium]|nr:DUF421 domain-containing protein [Oscillospiraceae bacterium]